MVLIWITQAKYIKDYKIALTFNDGKKKTVDLSHRLYGEVFEPLKNIEMFRNFFLNGWTIEWENGADLAPEYLYEL